MAATNAQVRGHEPVVRGGETIVVGQQRRSNSPTSRNRGSSLQGQNTNALFMATSRSGST
jgi:hypothetical protein